MKIDKKHTNLHHGLVPTQSQQHARAQLVLSQREQELLGLIARAHQDMNLKAESSVVKADHVNNSCWLFVSVCVHLPYWQTVLRRHHRPPLQDCRAGTSHLYLSAHSAGRSGPGRHTQISFFLVQYTKYKITSTLELLQAKTLLNINKQTLTSCLGSSANL